MIYDLLKNTTNAIKRIWNKIGLQNTQ